MKTSALRSMWWSDKDVCVRMCKKCVWVLLCICLGHLCDHMWIHDHKLCRYLLSWPCVFSCSPYTAHANLHIDCFKLTWQGHIEMTFIYPPSVGLFHFKKVMTSAGFQHSEQPVTAGAVKSLWCTDEVRIILTYLIYYLHYLSDQVSTFFYTAQVWKT